MPAPPTILGAVMLVLTGDSTLASLVPSGAWLGGVPPEYTLPWVVVHHEGEEPAWTSEAPYLETTRLRFEVYATRDVTADPSQPNHPAEACERICQVLKELLDDHPFAVANASSVKLRRTRYTVQLDPRRDPSGEWVYAGRLDYMAVLERQRTLPGG
jgi:hypothetical protein